MYMRIMYTYIYRLGVCAAQPQQSCNRATAATELQQSCNRAATELCAAGRGRR